MSVNNLISFFGLFALVGITVLFTSNRKAISLRLIGIGLSLQIIFALLVLGIPALNIAGPLKPVFDLSNDFVISVLGFSNEGVKIIFGDLADTKKYGFIFALTIPATIIFMSTLMAVLYHLGVMQKVVSLLAKLMQKTMKVSGAEALSTAANIFVGQTEAPLVIKPFISRMTNSELFCIMVGGMANTAGGVLAAYVGLLQDRIPGIAGHLITASVLSAPAALVTAKIIFPETETPETSNAVPTEYEKQRIDANTIEAAARGASEGMSLGINVIAMLIAFIALIAMIDAALGWAGGLFGIQISASIILGWFFQPIAWLMGVQWSECGIAGGLLAQKVVLNEFVAYFNLTKVMGELSDRTTIILSYALCGFANFSSVGIQIGGIGAMAPERRADLARLGLKAVVGGSIASFMTAAVAGMLIP
jgi:concentrative nucleoside transporter, CNT family